MGIVWALLMAAMVLTIAVPADRADDPGAQLVAVCASCHRLDGQGSPSIVGLSENDLKSAMWVFRSDESSNATMHAVSNSFSDTEIAIIAKRLSREGPQRRP